MLNSKHQFDLFKGYVSHSPFKMNISIYFYSFLFVIRCVCVCVPFFFADLLDCITFKVCRNIQALNTYVSHAVAQCVWNSPKNLPSNDVTHIFAFNFFFWQPSLYLLQINTTNQNPPTNNSFISLTQNTSTHIHAHPKNAKCGMWNMWYV